MASSLIHIAVADNLNKKLKRKKELFLIGSVAPDLSKVLGLTKIKSHFQLKRDNIPILDNFLKKYKNNLDDDFVLGYYVHLYTDYLWFKYFVPEIYDKDKELITTLDGKKLILNEDEMTEYIYNDYTNLNLKIINRYNLDLDFFENKNINLEHIIEEIPMDKIDKLLDKIVYIINNTKVHKDLVFNLENIENFISLSTELIESNLKELKIL